MPIVFIHGVNTRRDDDYDADVSRRDAFFRQVMLPAIVASPRDVAITSPYWGGHAARMYWDYACLPRRGQEALGGSDEATALLVARHLEDGPADGRTFLLDIAKSRGLGDVVDLLWASAWDDASAAQAEGLASLAARAAAYAQASPKPGWLGEMADDEQFVPRLLFEISQPPPPAAGAAPGPAPAKWEALGGLDVFGNLVSGAADKIKNVLGSGASTLLVNAGRSALQHRASDFLGDVFVYLDARGEKAAPGDIVAIVRDAIAAAAAKRSDADPLIVVGHSMGGDIAYDIFSYFRPDLACDVFVTVGSQVALFEELKLFKSSDRAIPGNGVKLVAKPGGVRAWINVFDLNDVLAFRTGGVFAGTQDYPFASGRSTLEAHSAYFRLPSFYERLGKRIKDALA